jgi:hypothetical protein
MKRRHSMHRLGQAFEASDRSKSIITPDGSVQKNALAVGLEPAEATPRVPVQHARKTPIDVTTNGLFWGDSPSCGARDNGTGRNTLTKHKLPGKDKPSPITYQPEDLITPYDNFLYLLAEIEEALVRGTVEWPPGAARQACRRVVEIFGVLTLTASEGSDD